ncbi:hypothetical protein ACH5RR_005157 [Cinchona calisaya]|uniref:DCD domain-containing protein n=1 Tax=Cinchona calisaya TaxID=153742 RepID=A0ABD3AKK8_9GENT
MGVGRKQEIFGLNETVPFNSNKPPNASIARNLGKSNLGGVIFGCKNSTIRECLFKQIFGLPAQHFSYVKNIDPGLPLFLFNYSDRKLLGIFEAASSGQMNINPYGWTSDGSERTLYPAQVQIRIRLQCQALLEDQFKPIILDNYYNPSHFWFELDHTQTRRLMSKLSEVAVAPGTFLPQNTAKWRTLISGLPSNEKKEEIGANEPAFLRNNFVNSPEQSGHQLPESSLGDQEADINAKDIMYMKLKELARELESSGAPIRKHVGEIATASDEKLGLESSLTGISGEKDENNGGSSFDLSDHPSMVAQLLEGMKELMAFKEEQILKANRMEQKLLEAEKEISQLKSRYMKLESKSNISLVHVDETGIESFDDLQLDLDESILLVGGYDGVSWLSSLDLYSPSQDVLKSLKPMNSVRSYSSVAKLNGELYVFGGGNGCIWYDTVESYNLAQDQWNACTPLNEKKGSLAGATLGNKIFAIGGGNGVECFSDVEMYDINVGWWISTRSMLQKRFALAAAELNGALYAIGGYDGNKYLKSAERFDPREHSWSRIESMNAKRGCHSVVVMNEKLYALGGYDECDMSPSVEIYDPRFGKWMAGKPMNQSRGYSAAAVVKESIYVIGGVKSGGDIIDTIECYKEGQDWQMTNLRAPGRRCFCPAIVLGN